MYRRSAAKPAFRGREGLDKRTAVEHDVRGGVGRAPAAEAMSVDSGSVTG